MIYQGGYPLCMDCMNFDKENWNFDGSNKAQCREDGFEQWIGEPACMNFTCVPDSKVAAFAGGR
jgi:hypothetical protein